MATKRSKMEDEQVAESEAEIVTGSGYGEQADGQAEAAPAATRTPKGPEVRWSMPRIEALIETVLSADGLNASQVVESLATHPAFADLEDGAILSNTKILTKLRELRKAGLTNLPILEKGQAGPRPGLHLDYLQSIVNRAIAARG